MDLPALVRRQLGDEEVRTAVALGDEDVLCVTPTRVLRYSGEGLLSDESVADYPLDVGRLEVVEGRRKTTFTLTDIDGSETFSVPRDRGGRALRAVLEGILRIQGVVEPEESVRGVYRFSELTLIVTDSRLVKLIGSAVWGEEYERYDFANVTGLEFETGSVATQIVLVVDGHPQRIKAPNESFRLVEEAVRGALFEYYDVETVEEFDQLVGEPAEEESDDTEPTGTEVAFDSGVEPVTPGQTSEESTAESTEPSQSEGPAEQLAENGFTSAAAKVEPSIDPDDLEAHLDELEATLEAQAEAIETQQELLEALRDLIPDQ